MGVAAVGTSGFASAGGGWDADGLAATVSERERCNAAGGSSLEPPRTDFSATAAISTTPAPTMPNTIPRLPALPERRLRGGIVSRRASSIESPAAASRSGELCSATTLSEGLDTGAEGKPTGVDVADAATGAMSTATGDAMPRTVFCGDCRARGGAYSTFASGSASGSASGAG